jgi:hypothetical protein
VAVRSKEDDWIRSSTASGDSRVMHNFDLSLPTLLERTTRGFTVRWSSQNDSNSSLSGTVDDEEIPVTMTFRDLDLISSFSFSLAINARDVISTIP